MKHLTVAAAQITCQDGNVQGNLAHATTLAELARAQGAELLLCPEFMPHSYCTPTVPTRMTSQTDIDRLNQLPGRAARLYNNWFGVPVLMCNKSGAWNSPVPDHTLGEPKDFRFSGRSLLLDADGEVRGELGEEETVLVGAVTLDPALKKHHRPSQYSRYIYPGSPGREIIRLMEWRGWLSYTFSSVRKAKAAQALCLA